jgi:hypothetical protein
MLTLRSKILITVAVLNGLCITLQYFEWSQSWAPEGIADWNLVLIAFAVIVALTVVSVAFDSRSHRS